MEQEDQYRFYEESAAREPVGAQERTQPSTPMGAPKRKSRLGGWIIGIVIAAVVVAAGIGIWRTFRGLQVQIRKTEDGVSVRIGKKQTDPAPKQEPTERELTRATPETPQPVLPPQTGTELTLSPS